MGPNYFETRGGREFQSKLLRALEKLGDQLERANDLKEKELEQNKEDEEFFTLGDKEEERRRRIEKEEG